MREDYYELLEVQATATKQELRAAYHRLAMRYHPDHSGDNPAAEERFKLIAEAWHTLSDNEKRADYDAWLERHKRYAHMPELAGMRRRARVSAHQAERRRESSRRNGTPRRRPRLFLLRRNNKGGLLYQMLIYLCFLFAMVPYFAHHFSGNRASAATEPTKKTEASDTSPLSPEEQQKNLELYLKQLISAAENGDALAQYRYGCLLFLGSSGIRQDRQEARHWWEKAAAQGSRLAQQALKRMDEAASE